MLASGSGPTQTDIPRLQRIIAALKKIDIHVVVLAIGTEMDKQQLRFLVSKDRDLIDVESFSTLTAHGDNLYNIVCTSSGRNSNCKMDE